MPLRPPLSASFISSYDIWFDAELSHIVHSPIAQVDRPVIRALPKYRNRASVDNAFNILAVSLPWIWTAANPSGVSPCRRETYVTWEYTREYTCGITYRSPLNVAIENATRINIYRSKGHRTTELWRSSRQRRRDGNLPRTCENETAASEIIAMDFTLINPMALRVFTLTHPLSKKF